MCVHLKKANISPVEFTFSGEGSSTRRAKNSPQDCFLNALFDSHHLFAAKRKDAKRRLYLFGADDGNRTHTISLEG